MTAGYAKSQMNPSVAHLQTLFTTVRGSRSNISNFKYMRTAGHDCNPPDAREKPNSSESPGATKSIHWSSGLPSRTRYYFPPADDGKYPLPVHPLDHLALLATPS